MALRLDGKTVAEHLKATLVDAIAGLAARGVVPRLVVVSAGEDPGSRVYVRNKEKSAAALGIAFARIALPADVTQAELLRVVRETAADPATSGLIVQLPLPAHIDPLPIQEAVPLAKDVDGLNAASLGRLIHGLEAFPPCTPAGVLDILDHYRIPVAGRHAVIVGRSNIVGKPLALMLLARHATVTICHSRTADLPAFTRAADLLVAAVGKPRMIRGDMIKPGAAVIDVGINRVDGGIVGDVAFDEADHAGWITPVPGGVGLMTVARLMANVVAAAAAQHPA